MIDESELRQLYETEGLTIGVIAKRLGVGHRAALKLLMSHDIKLRTPAEQKRREIERLTADERESLMTGCRIATRGAKQSDEHRRKIAQTRQFRACLSGDEAEIMRAMNQRGLFPTPLLAVDRYNIDFAFPSEKIAVEYNGGNWHNTPKKMEADERKSRYLRQEGWKLLVFPRLLKQRRSDSGNARISLNDLVSQVAQAVHGTTPPPTQGPTKPE